MTLERQREFAPAFRVQTQLEVPGPDFHAEARDHTLQAALLKVARELERQIRSRKSRRADRRKTNVQLGPGHGDEAGGLQSVRRGLNRNKRGDMRTRQSLSSLNIPGHKSQLRGPGRACAGGTAAPGQKS